MREVTYDFESMFTFSKKKNENHVFVVGLARSGTTILLNALYESNEFSSLSYRDMPFVLAPNIWSKFSLFKKNPPMIERSHGDGINFSIDSPESFEEVFWSTFDENQTDIEEKFKTYIQLINKKSNKNRYLSKNNQNIRRLGFISNMFPNSKILVPFREPIQQAKSLLFQHKRFLELCEKDKFISDYMKWIGHTEFGPNYNPIKNSNLIYKDHLDLNHWIEQWYLVYKDSIKLHKDQGNIIFICHERLCTSKEIWTDLLKLLDIKSKYDFEFHLSKKHSTLSKDNEIIRKASTLYAELCNLKLC